MIYCDTSLVVSALTAETHTTAAQRWFAGHESVGFAASHWVSTEVASALAMKLRRGVVDAEQRTASADQWRRLAASWKMIDVERRHFVHAASLVNAGLRAGDALHLAITIDYGMALATLDHDLASIATSVGVELHRPDRPQS